SSPNATEATSTGKIRTTRSRRRAKRGCANWAAERCPRRSSCPSCSWMTNISRTTGKAEATDAKPRRTDDPSGIYIHVSCGVSKCGYCDFYSRVRQDQKAGYLAALGEEIRGYKGQGIPVDTIFFGGGTPSVLSPDEIGGILAALRESFTLLPEGEWT